MKTLHEIVKIKGRFMNHSLRATSASHVFAKKVPEQVIKEITGHKSDCVCVHKCTSNAMLAEVSKVISGTETNNETDEQKE